MNNLKTTLLTKNSRYDLDESGKQGSSVQFDSSSEQRITKFSIPSSKMVISYRGLSNTEFQTLRGVFEDNYANTFILDLDNFMDMRKETMTVNSATWGFSDFQFSKYPSGCINGEITLVTSLLFNFTEYQDLFTETSTNIIDISTDTTFKLLLQTSSPRSVAYNYLNNTLLSNIGRSQRLTKDKRGLRRVYTFQWLLRETEFLALLQYYRKHAGIMGEFGMTDFDIDDALLINSRFMTEDIQYVKRLDGLYETELQIVEIKA